MALARLITFTPLTLIKAADVNGEFNNILNNPVSLLSPTTGPINFNLQLHTNLLPSAITASSATTGQALIATSTGGTIFGGPANAGYRVGGLVATNNAGAATTKYDISADIVVLRNPTSGSTLVKTNTGTITNDVTVAGSTANGRDQAGAFSASSFIHFYFIAKDDGTLATLSSATAPPTGPTLPATYTSWAYVGAVRFSAGSALLAVTMRGNKAFYTSAQSALSGGGATVETTVSLATLIPTNALRAGLWCQFVNVTNAAANVIFRVISGQDYFKLSQTTTTINSGNAVGTPEIPNISQQVIYINSGASDATSILVQHYTMPNGGE